MEIVAGGSIGMRWRYWLIVLALLAGGLVVVSSAQGTVLPATITASTTLTRIGSPYTGSTTIEAGVTVTVEPGVKFINPGMTVKGTLKAEGTAEEPIVFAGAKEEPGSEWCVIWFSPGSSASVINHAEVRHGGGCNTGAIGIYGSSPTIENSTFQDNHGYAIKVAEGGSPEIANNRILNSGTHGIYYKTASTQTGEVNIHGNYVEGGLNGIIVENNGTGAVFGKTLGGNTVKGTTNTALLYKGPDIPGDITGNTLEGNKSNIIFLGGTVAHSETWNNGGSPIQFEGSVTVVSGATLTITKGVLMLNPGMTVKGTLKAEGTAEEPIVFAGAKEEPGSEWCVIWFSPGSSASVINHAEVRHGGGCNTGAIGIYGSSPTIENSTFQDNHGYAIKVAEGGSPEIANNRILNSGTHGIYYKTASTQTGEVNIHGNYVEGGLNGIIVENNGTGAVFGKTLGGNTVKGTTNTALLYKGPDIPGDITGNTLEGNKSNIIFLGGTVAHSETWNNGGSPIQFEGSVTVVSGATLTITKGVLMLNPGMTVKGTLKAEGTAEEPIVFAGAKEEPGSEWCVIWFSPGSSASVINHAEVRHGGGCNTGAIGIYGSSPTIENSTFQDNHGYAIKVAEGGSPEIANNRILNSGTHGIYYKTASTQTGEVNIHGNYVEGGLNGIIVENNGTGAVFGKTLGGNTVKGTTNTALLYKGPDIPGDITGNTLEGNTADEIQISGTVGHSQTWSLGNAPAKFIGAVTVPSGVTLSLQPGVYIRNPLLTVFGTLRAEGTASRPVALTGAAQAESGEWGGIRLESGSGASVLNFVEVAFGGSGGAMLNIKGVSPTVTNSTFRRSSADAIRVQLSGHPAIEGNRFRGNEFGLRYEGEGKLSAPRNDWGCANGPKPTGCGDQVTSNVEWQPAVVLQELPRLCPGTNELASSSPCLLHRYEPMLKLDSEENYLADSAAEITDNWGDEEGLQHKGALGTYSNMLFDGSSPVTESRPEGFYSMFPLSLNALGSSYPAEYGAADADDWLDESNEYVRDAHLLEEAGYAEAAYGQAITDGSGMRWLEYWYWYYYNPKSFAGVGTHEGDWESVLVGLDANNRPLEVIFSQHESPSNCYIGDVELTEEGGPVVYVAVDSHANYRMSGSFDGGVIVDYADGNGPAVQPGLVILQDSPPSWLAWPGHWGNSRGGGLNSESPTGPAFHGSWSDPAGYAAGADECSRTLEEEELEEPYEMRSAESTAYGSMSSVTFHGRQPQVEYRVPGADGEGFWPRLRISVNELGDGGIPPVSQTISNVKARGKIALPVEVNPGKSAEVLGSIVYKSGRRVHLAPRTVRSP